MLNSFIMLKVLISLLIEVFFILMDLFSFFVYQSVPQYQNACLEGKVNCVFSLVLICWQWCLYKHTRSSGVAYSLWVLHRLEVFCSTSHAAHYQCFKGTCNLCNHLHYQLLASTQLSRASCFTCRCEGGTLNLLLLDVLTSGLINFYSLYYLT